jgi:hypothetical protein
VGSFIYINKIQIFYFKINDLDSTIPIYHITPNLRVKYDIITRIKIYKKKWHKWFSFFHEKGHVKRDL